MAGPDAVRAAAMIRRVRAPVARATQGGEPVATRPRPAGVPHQSATLRIARVPALIRSALLAALLVAVSFPSARAGNPIERGNGRPVKVMIIATFGSERQVWLDRLEPWRAIRVPGLAPDYPDVHCNQSEICVFTTGMGHSNSTASVTALVFSGLFKLSHTYFIVAAVAGIDPAQGTPWARRPGRATWLSSVFSGRSTRGRSRPTGRPGISGSTLRVRRRSRPWSIEPKCSSSMRLFWGGPTP